jgi:hypothetical protein
MTDLTWYLHQWVFPAAFAVLPGQMNSREARAMLLASGLQESGFAHRKQIGGPARGFWQFEKDGGVKEILTSPETKALIVPICELLRYEPISLVCHEAITHNDVLAACFARLLLWRDPRALPSPIEADKGWAIYRANWRPGKPHPETWRQHFETAWSVVKGEVL